MNKVCVNIACGNSYIDGWLNFDYAPISSTIIKANLLGGLPLDDSKVDVLYSSHFLEHIPRKRLAGFLLECYRIMKPGGQIRFVLPDLDNLCREYLHRRDIGEHAKADFVILEMLDQCVRTMSRGELGEYYEKELSERQSYMIDYIATRTGENVATPTILISKWNWMRILIPFTQPKKIWAKLEKLYCYFLTLLLPSAFREQNINFTHIGERHTWIYDFHSLSKLLKQAGFVSIKKLNFNQSEIEDFPLTPLDVNEIGKPRKGLESMYVEARKP